MSLSINLCEELSPEKTQNIAPFLFCQNQSGIKLVQNYLLTWVTNEFGIYWVYFSIEDTNLISKSWHLMQTKLFDLINFQVLSNTLTYFVILMQFHMSNDKSVVQ